jgi:hypothetical protein
MKAQPAPLTHKLILVTLGLIAGCMAMIVVRLYSPNPEQPNGGVVRPSADSLADTVRHRWSTNLANRGVSTDRPSVGLASTGSRPAPGSGVEAIAGAETGQSDSRSATSPATGTLVDQSRFVQARATGVGTLDVRYNSVPNEGKLRVDGTSTVHDWHAESTVIGGSIEADAGFPDVAKGKVMPKVDINIPVRTLKSSGGRKMLSCRST